MYCVDWPCALQWWWQDWSCFLCEQSATSPCHPLCKRWCRRLVIHMGKTCQRWSVHGKTLVPGMYVLEDAGVYALTWGQIYPQYKQLPKCWCNCPQTRGQATARTDVLLPCHSRSVPTSSRLAAICRKKHVGQVLHPVNAHKNATHLRLQRLVRDISALGIYVAVGSWWQDSHLAVAHVALGRWCQPRSLRHVNVSCTDQVHITQYIVHSA